MVMYRSSVTLFFNGKSSFPGGDGECAIGRQKVHPIHRSILDFFRRMSLADPMPLFLNTHPSFDNAAADQDIHAAVHGTTLTGFIVCHRIGFTFTKC